MEATLPPTKQSDCEGHFVNIPALPHSVMVFHNCDLIGQALSEFTGVDIPFKTQTSGMGFHDHGMQIISWTVRVLSHHTPWLFPHHPNHSISSLKISSISLYLASSLVLTLDSSFPRYWMPSLSSQSVSYQWRAWKAKFDLRWSITCVASRNWQGCIHSRWHFHDWSSKVSCLWILSIVTGWR